jgi:uncharacterized protein YndB with AHSA1/START domain
MTENNQTLFTKDPSNKKITVVREFDAPLKQVWKAWTESILLDAWWAPKPWVAKTKSMDFSEGGTWLYAMIGPDGSEQWCRADYKTIVPHKMFSYVDSFCNKDGEEVTGFPNMQWNCEFVETPAGTRVEIEITFDSEENLQKIVEMGFEEGFKAGIGNLVELLANV